MSESISSTGSNSFSSSMGGSISSNPLASTTTTATTMVPLQAMLFIDGTWLYHSIHDRSEQDCPIIQRFGLGWQNRYCFDWSKLPDVICHALQQQQQNIFVPTRTTTEGVERMTPTTLSSSSSSSLQQDHHFLPLEGQVTSGPIEITRVMAFASYKTDTSPHSNRFKMFEDMANENYNVHMMDTVGKSEKGVGIELAVEMLHYATVPNAYDIALLLTGDKDFMPAMIRTRQKGNRKKGRRVGLVSMKQGCHRNLVDSPNIKDYDIVWIEDYLEDLIRPKKASAMTMGLNNKQEEEQHVSTFTLMKIVSDFLSKSGFDRVSSRDIGRYLKTLKIGGGDNSSTNTSSKDKRSILRELKETYGGLYHFLVVTGAYDVNYREQQSIYPNDKSYWVSLKDNAEEKFTDQAKKSLLSKVEKDFLNNIYSLEALGGKKKEEVYLHTLQLERKSWETETSSSTTSSTTTGTTLLSLSLSSTKSTALYNDEEKDDDNNNEEDEEDKDKNDGNEDEDKNDNNKSNSIDSKDVMDDLLGDSTLDCTKCNFVELNECCRERGQALSGKKSILIECAHAEQQIAKMTHTNCRIGIKKKKKNQSHITTIVTLWCMFACLSLCLYFSAKIQEKCLLTGEFLFISVQEQPLSMSL